MFKVFMKRNFAQHFVDCIEKISWNCNVTSLVEFLWLYSLSRYSTLLDMQRTQPPTSYCIMSVYQIAYFVAYDNENKQNYTCMYVGYV